MKKVLNSVVLAGFALLALSACDDQSTAKTEQLSRVVWSDDNSAQALVVMRYDESTPAMNPISAGGLQSNFTHQIYVQNADGSNRHAVGIEFQGQSGYDLYFMKESGYIVGTMVEASDNNQAVTRYYLLRMDGTVNRLTEKPDMKVIPSPNGGTLARITQYPATCGNPAGNCPVDVEFLDAQSLDPLGQKTQLSFSSGSGQLPALTWNQEGQFIVSDGAEAKAIAPATGEVSETTVPACTFPATTSSQVSASGQYVYSSAGQVMSRQAAANEPAFGCQG